MIRRPPSSTLLPCTLLGGSAGQPLGGAEWGGGELYRERWYVAHRIGHRWQHGEYQLLGELRAEQPRDRQPHCHHGDQRGQRGSRSRRLYGLGGWGRGEDRKSVV